MSRKRNHISLKTKLASALLALDDVPWEEAKLMTPDQIISLYHFDHFPVRHVDGGTDDFWNLEPVLIKSHRVKTAKVDRPQIAKDRRVSDKWQEFTARMNAKTMRVFEKWEQPKEHKRRKIPSRPFPKRTDKPKEGLKK